MSTSNHNYMAIPKHSTPITATVETTYESSVIDNTSAWYGLFVTEDAAIKTINFDDGTTRDFTGFPLPTGTPIYGNIVSFVMVSGSVIAHTYS